MSTLDAILDGLMERYRANVPEVPAILKAMMDEGAVGSSSGVVNDHIAFRTLGVPNLGIASLEKVFLTHGYQRRDRYRFNAKKLEAFWYSPPSQEHPRIFISELKVDELSGGAQRLIRSYTDEVKADPVDALDLSDGTAVVEFLHRPLWRAPRWGDYQELLSESEYAAWVIYNRYYLNHYTISVHALRPPFDTLQAFDAFLERRGFRLNDSGGKVKVSADGKLLQSSTVAAMVDARFADGVHRISGSYVEFAERRVLDEFRHLPPEHLRREHRREGFEADNADRIFESTYTSQTRRG